MFVRTKDNLIYELKDKTYINSTNGTTLYETIDSKHYITTDRILMLGDNLEDLIKGGDLIIVSDSNDNKLPIIYEKYHFDCWCKTHDNLISKMEWYIKNGNDYKLVVTKQGKGEWELL